MSALVNSNTKALILLANRIVSSCTGSGCNLSTTTRREITLQLSQLSLEQAQSTLMMFMISPNSTLARNINSAYLELGAVVSSVYNYQCGDNVNTSEICVTLSSSVSIAEEKLVALLTAPTIDKNNDVLVLSILFSIMFASAFLFLIFLFVGLSSC